VLLVLLLFGLSSTIPFHGGLLRAGLVGGAAARGPSAPASLVVGRPAAALPNDGTDYTTAVGATEAVASGYGAGGWALVDATGYLVRSPLNFSVPAWSYSAPSPTSVCGWQALGGASLGGTVFPPTPSDIGPGLSEAWLFLFSAPGNAVLVVTVLNGSAALLAALPANGPCNYGFGQLQPIASGVIDSAQAVQIADSVGGSTFLLAHPGAEAILAIDGADPNGLFNCPEGGCPPGTGESVWNVTYNVEASRLAANGTNASVIVAQFSAVIDALNGSVLSGSTVPGTTKAAPPSTYSVTFRETGLPGGAAWWVTFDGTTRSGTGELSFPGMLNGSYAFLVGSAAGYPATPGNGSLTVAGGPVAQSIDFASPSVAQPSTMFAGVPPMAGFLVLGGAVAAAALGVLVAFRWRRRRTAPIAPAGVT
jgi:hypothetical protein